MDSRCDEVDVIRIEAGGVIRKFKDTMIKHISNCFCLTVLSVPHVKVVHFHSYPPCTSWTFAPQPGRAPSFESHY